MRNSCGWLNYDLVTIQNQTVIMEIVYLIHSSNYTTKKELKYATVVDAPNLAAKNIIALKSEFN